MSQRTPCWQPALATSAMQLRLSEQQLAVRPWRGAGTGASPSPARRVCACGALTTGGLARARICWSALASPSMPAVKRLQWSPDGAHLPSLLQAAVGPRNIRWPVQLARHAASRQTPKDNSLCRYCCCVGRVLLVCIVGQAAASCILVVDGEASVQLSLAAPSDQVSLGHKCLVVRSASQLAFWALIAPGTLQLKAQVHGLGFCQSSSLQAPAASPCGRFFACTAGSSQLQLLLLDARYLAVGVVLVARHTAVGSVATEAGATLAWLGQNAAWRLDKPGSGLLGNPQQHCFHLQAAASAAPQSTPAHLIYRWNSATYPATRSMLIMGAVSTAACILCGVLYILLAEVVAACLPVAILVTLPVLMCLSGRLAMYQIRVPIYATWRYLYPGHQDWSAGFVFFRFEGPNTLWLLRQSGDAAEDAV